MAEKLKIISLGGLNEIGKNMTVYEFGEDIIVVDCGMGFPDDDMYGIDIVIPDTTYLVKNKDRIRGIILTHGPVSYTHLDVYKRQPPRRRVRQTYAATFLLNVFSAFLSVVSELLRLKQDLIILKATPV